MEGFTQVVERLNSLVEEADQTFKSGVIITNGTRGMLESNRDRLVQIADELKEIQENHNTGNPVFDNMISVILMHHHNWYTQYIEYLSKVENPKPALIGFYHTISMSEGTMNTTIFPYNSMYWVAHLMTVILRDKDRINFDSIQAENASLKEQLCSMQARLKKVEHLVIPELIEYDYVAIKSRLDPYRAEMKLVHRTFARIIRARYDAPIAIAISK
jgi:hypothetical protein